MVAAAVAAVAAVAVKTVGFVVTMLVLQQNAASSVNKIHSCAV
jgi:hypothetical protein